MSQNDATSGSERILGLFKVISYLFMAVAIVNLIVQVFASISNEGSAVSAIGILAQNIQVVVVSFFFIGFVEFIAIVRKSSDED